MFAVCVPAPVTRVPGTAPGACVAGPHSPRPPPFAPLAPQRTRSALFAGFTATMAESDFSCPCIIGYDSSPSRCGPPAAQVWSDTRDPRFRRAPFARDVALDPGGTTMPRITASHMLRSTMKTVSAPAISSFRGSLPHPTQRLCTLRVRRRRRLTQHSLPGGLLRPYLGRTCTG